MPKRAAHFIPLSQRLIEAVRHWGAAEEAWRQAIQREGEASDLAVKEPTPEHGRALEAAIADTKAKSRLWSSARDEYQSVLMTCLSRWREVGA